MKWMKRGIIIVVALCIITLAAWGTWQFLATNRTQKETPAPTPPAPVSKVTDFASCVAAGNPVTMTSPRTCRAGETVYTEQIAVEKSATMEFTSPKGVVVRLYDWTKQKTLTSPAVVTGEIPGNWSFEATFPVAIADGTGKTLTQTPARLQGDWMTTNYVPFSVTLTFTSPTMSKVGTLILHKDNPSGLSKNDDTITVPITFQ